MKKKKGFTLIELVLAIVIMAFVVTGASLLIMGVVSGRFSLTDSVSSLNLARMELEKTMNLNFTDIENYKNNNYQGSSYILSREVAYLPGTSENIKEITVRVFDSGDNLLCSLLLLRGKNIPLVFTEKATDIKMTKAVLNAGYNFRDYQFGQVRFKYKEKEEKDWIYTNWQEKEGYGDYSEEAKSLRPRTSYNFAAQLQFEKGIITGKEGIFFTGVDEPPGEDPFVVTGEAVLVGRRHARLYMDYNFGAYGLGRLRFEYWLEGEGSRYTAWEEPRPPEVSGSYNNLIMNLDSGNYFFRAQLEYNDAIIEGGEESFRVD